MRSFSRRTVLTSSIAGLATFALTPVAQAAPVALNNETLPGGNLRFTPLNEVKYVNPYAQAFTATPATGARFIPAPEKSPSDALVSAQFTTVAPARGSVVPRVILRRTGDGKNFYAASLTVRAYQKYTLAIERIMNGKTEVIKKQDLTIPRPLVNENITFDLAISARLRHIEAQFVLTGREAMRISIDDTAVPLSATPAGTGTGFSGYVSKDAPAATPLDANNATAGAWGQFRGALTQPANSQWGKMIFEDDFDAPAINDAKWRVRNNDYVGYDKAVILSDAVTVEESVAKIWLKKLPTGQERVYNDGKVRNWATGYIDTIGKFSAENFRLEYRAKQPVSRAAHIGAWGGVWMRPDDTNLLGEIDISESYGYTSGKQKTDPSNRSEGTVHYGQEQGNKAKQNKMIPVLGQVLADEFHTWAVEKTPAGIRFFFDDIEYLFVSSSDPRYQSSLPGGAKFNIRLSMQAGNEYWGGLSSSTSDSAIEVDYVRVWEYKG